MAAADVPVVSARPSAAPADTLLQVVPARSWWALGGLSAVLAGVLLWGVFGSVATTIDGQGIITRPGGLFNAVANDGGPIATVLVKVGDTVQKGDLLARIQHPLRRGETNAARAEHARLRSEYDEFVKLLGEGDARYLAALAKQRATLEGAIAAHERNRRDIGKGLQASRVALRQQRKVLEALVGGLEQRVKAERPLLDKLSQEVRTGAAAARDLETARRDIAALEDRLNVARADLARHEVTAVEVEMTARREEDRAEDSIQGYDVQLSTLAREEVERSTRQKEQLLAKRSAVAAAEDRLRFLEARQRACSEVVSNWDGRVVEIPVDPGQVVLTGATVVAIEVGEPTLVVSTFVPAWGAKKIKPGMKVEVTPAVVQRAEYGYMVGTVRSVSPFTSSPEGAYQQIPNKAIVEQLTRGGANLYIEVEPQRDPATPSGYHWSTGRGPDLAIESGMFCQVRVVTREQAPVTLLLPALRKFFGAE
jgi:HlyD family secretion protein